MKAIVLAAGKGTRLQSEETDLPKALRRLDGKPLIRYVLDNLGFLPPQDITIVVGFLKEQVMATLGDTYRYVEQPQPYSGTAKAALSARDLLGDVPEPILVCYCDMPFLSTHTYRRMFEAHAATGAGHTLLAGRMDPPPPFGRLIRDAQGRLIDIIEESAATEVQRRITEVNVGLQVFDGMRIWGWLERIDNNNPKHEYYLTSAARVVAADGVLQTVVPLDDLTETLGINSMEDLASAERLMRERKPAH